MLNPTNTTAACFYLLTGLLIATLRRRADEVSRARFLLTVPGWPLDVLDFARAYVYRGFARACERLWTTSPARRLQRALLGQPTFEFRVRNFARADQFARALPGYALYTATFVVWTATAGVALFKCSDGESRMIPVVAVESDAARLPHRQPD